MASTGGVATTICAVVLVAAGISKLNDLGGFSQQVLMYKVLPPSLARGVGHGLPPFEIGLGVALFFLPVMGVVAASVFLGFAAAVGINVLRGRTELRCACFGARGTRTVSRSHALINVFFACLAGWSAFAAQSPAPADMQIGVSIVALAALLETGREMRSQLESPVRVEVR